ncbi:MAG: 2OG-Fe(II) oxygenase [Parvularculaceae bacterium]
MTETPMGVPAFKIDASSDEASRRFNRDLLRRRVHIPDFLRRADADRMASALGRLDRWNIVTTSRGRHLDLDAKGAANFSAEDRRKFDAAVHATAQTGFQYLFENFPLYDAWHAGTIKDPTIAAIFEFLNCDAMLDYARRVTAMPEIAFADAQATRYSAGHFLTEHNDDVAGKNRCAAYVLNLTPGWRPDWGGLLMFIGGDGHVEEAFTPSYNALNIFAVPQRHSVSVVAPFAPAIRLSVTGWFRFGDDPMQASSSSANR